VARHFFIGALTKVGPNNEECDAAFEVVSVINCRLPKRPDTGRAAGRSKPKGTVTVVGEKARIAWEPFPRKWKESTCYAGGHDSIASAVATRTGPEAYTSGFLWLLSLPPQRK
jgi:hypothetical protein